MPTPPAETEPRVVLYSRAGCHLCDTARDLVAAVAAERGATWAEVDVDSGGTAADGRSLAAAYGELLPVVEVDGARVGYWQIDRDRLVDALAAPRRA
ncbi:glutaredoxin family protein [Cellulomonas pakistanensis]|uniref:Thioredoxin family protein n=1 Tax=Cellulomonas pakistanensis TaxID=992287 RepID=A0A919P7Y7_9CELL|nr:glutaredoxin family protein [Cellulomonas pakistanensis]GIG36029.1 thioredoxin family protein [Cellulomonas pakistanensis]